MWLNNCRSRIRYIRGSPDMNQCMYFGNHRSRRLHNFRYIRHCIPNRSGTNQTVLQVLSKEWQI